MVVQLPPIFQKMYEQYQIPFEIHPGFMLLPSNTHNAITHSSNNNNIKSHENQQEDVTGVMHKPIALTVPLLQQQVQFTVDEIVATAGTTTSATMSHKIIPERRQTAWEGDDDVSGFQYSGKVMKRYPWSESVLQTRNVLQDRLFGTKTNTNTTTTTTYYDGCLINLYDHSNSGMRYHSDPDQGTIWDYDTTVVSVGASRKFAFRSTRSSSSNNNQQEQQSSSLPYQQQQQPHTFVVMDGDITHMYHDCQQRYQHTVKKAEDPNEMALRASLVFKRTLSQTK